MQEQTEGRHRRTEGRGMQDRRKGDAGQKGSGAGRWPHRWGALAQALRSLVAPLWRNKLRPQAAAKVLAPLLQSAGRVTSP